MAEEPMLTVAEAAEMAGVSGATITARIRGGVLTAEEAVGKHGRKKFLVPEREVRVLMETGNLGSRNGHAPKPTSVPLADQYAAKISHAVLGHLRDFEAKVRKQVADEIRAGIR